MKKTAILLGKLPLGVVPLMAVILMAGCVAVTKSENLKKSGSQVVAEPHAAEALAAVGITAPQFPFPLEPPYQGPSVSGNAASIKGSEVQNAGLLGMVGDEKAFVLSVDGKRLMAGMAGWNTEVKIDPGLRIVTVEFDSQGRGSSIGGQGFGTAQADLQVNAIPGSNYIVQFKVVSTSLAGSVGVDFWIVDAATGKTVTNIIGALPLTVDLEAWQAIDEFYGLPPYAGPGEAQHAHPPLDQGETPPSATGPKYLYTEQNDPASVGGGISQIDGFEVGFSWSMSGKTWVSPGKHALALTLSQDTPDGTGGTFSFTGSYTVEAEFAANHMYRFTSSAYGDLCCVNLWDETDGLATRSIAGSWVFRGQETYNPPPDTSDITPTHHEHERKH